MSLVVKVFGCRPHEGGAAHTGAGVRKPPMEETAGKGYVRRCGVSYGRVNVASPSAPRWSADAPVLGKVAVSSVRSVCPRLYPLIGPAARRSRLPRERFCPLAPFGRKRSS